MSLSERLIAWSILPLILTSIFDQIKMDVPLNARFFLCSTYLIQTVSLLVAQNTFSVFLSGEEDLCTKNTFSYIVD